MIVDIAIGDAYGAGFEFAPREKIERFNTLMRFVPHETGIAAGHYTDDTQMSIAVCEVLLSGGPASSDEFAEAFVRCYRRDPRQGYAKGLQGLFDQSRDGRHFRSLIRPGSRRNGAAMRSVPLGLLASVAEIDQVSRSQAVVTHDTPEGILSSKVVALMVHYALYQDKAVAELARLVERDTGFRLRGDWHGEVECDAIQTLHAVHTALLNNRSTSGLLRDCVNYGGDVDSVAAIAMGVASVSLDYVDDTPDVLRRGLEAGPYGQPFLLQLDDSLRKRFPRLASRSR
ncbi:ADP-ribosylglycohydrolase family protein [Dyella mobilis]|uniref:ADP-ribosylglycohydrolase family protein n=1 Tax=Dyella mobilis TaxID=1849582 RepID=A0ABS2KGL3_9GAMM|nr:ADP-ribosylglycohydrolase family protein [Dyella mobilis]MBM7129518.1 ADP-ribosylglycohydrolase family protein [Dyella mobilis]GLQ98217.1 ADP-ribosyl-[dinitrogen reductase] glycohydrolase [Dyella mobilis]